MLVDRVYILIKFYIIVSKNMLTNLLNYINIFINMENY